MRYELEANFLLMLFERPLRSHGRIKKSPSFLGIDVERAKKCGLTDQRLKLHQAKAARGRIEHPRIVLPQNRDDARPLLVDISPPSVPRVGK